MTENFTEGIAFIFEGETEKIFYINLLTHLASVSTDTTFEKQLSDNDGEFYYVWKDLTKSILIKTNNVGTITQIANSGSWFENKCCKNQLPWTVYLCYDTDSSSNNISKFYCGDWLRLRTTLEQNKATVVDLAAHADIEDILLYDLEGICEFLAIDLVSRESLRGRKGKAKLKTLFRQAGQVYHEGERAKRLIEALDCEKIISTAPIKLSELKAHLQK